MLEQLAQLLKTRKGKYILFLGAGASLSSGGKTTKEIVASIIEKYKLNSHDPWNSFCNFLKRKGKKERFDILSPYFEGMNPSPGYKTLAEMIEEGYFKLILTTNFDYMLEEVLKETNLVLNRDYFVCIVGEGKEDILTKKLEDGSMIRIVKLHGDYKSRILPFTEEETFRFEKELEECLKKLTKEGIIFVGYSGMDRDVLKCLSQEGESVWWVNPRKVTADITIAEKNSDEYSLNEDIYRVLINRKSHGNFIWGEHGKSDAFFEKIYEKISVRDINSFCDQFKFGETRYRKMKDLFEPPYQYEEMKRKLNEYKVLLILGEPHLGKTYTALNLLYDYYVEGFTVDFRSELYRREMQQEMMYQWEDLLKPDMVIYLEDPFGKTESENVQIFRSELRRIIQRIQNSKSMVIITSRSNIFKEIGDPDEFPMIVELMKHDISYDLEKRKRIIDKYVAVYKPTWTELLDKNIDKVSLKEYIARELKEPHNINIFFEKSLKIEDIRVLFDKVDESKEVLKAFTQEIEGSSTAEKVFFYICYIFGRVEGFELAENSYLKVLRNFNLDPYRYDFRKFLKKHNFRVETYHEIGLKIKFSHPTFSKAIEKSFVENASIIGEILLELIEDNNYSIRRRITKTLAGNFDKLPEEYRKILFELAKSEDVEIRRIVAWGIQYNFDKLPEEYRKILFKLIKDKDDKIRKRATKTLTENFDKLPEEYRKILFELAKSEDVEIRRIVAWGIQYNFDKLPEEYRKILFKLIKDKDDKIMEIVAETIQQNFEKLPEEYRKILFELAKVRRRYIRKIVARTLCMNFDKLPEEYRKILFELAKHEIFGIPIYFIPLQSFREDIPIRLREDIPIRLREYTSLRGSLAETLCMNFDKLPEEYRKILFELARNKNFWIKKSVVYAITMNFDKLPEEYRKILFELARNKNFRVKESVVYAITMNFDKLPEEYRKILFELARSEDVEIRRIVVETVRYNFGKLTEEYKELLSILSEDEN
ncbi:MAG: HEAT repeat domain-containing protein [Theionarchaea archaeon]|nr:HEAT repeat domain-containing protein [Theionarchaea archaeon]